MVRWLVGIIQYYGVLQDRSRVKLLSIALVTSGKRILQGHKETSRTNKTIHQVIVSVTMLLEMHASEGFSA